MGIFVVHSAMAIGPKMAAVKNKKSAKVIRRLATMHVQEVNFIASEL